MISRFEIIELLKRKFSLDIFICLSNTGTPIPYLKSIIFTLLFPILFWRRNRRFIIYLIFFIRSFWLKIHVLIIRNYKAYVILWSSLAWFLATVSLTDTFQSFQWHIFFHMLELHFWIKYNTTKIIFIECIDLW